MPEICKNMKKRIEKILVNVFFLVWKWISDVEYDNHVLYLIYF